MKCLHPFALKGKILPCGKCEACRGTYVDEWIARFLCESESFSRGAVFGTLTYNDENLPEDENLCMKDMQDFFKRVKRRLNLYNIGTRYMYAGEYGSNKGRPHYHFILSGLSRENMTEERMKKIISVIEDCWEYGYTNITPVVNPVASIRYMIGYALKFEGKFAKRPGEKAEEYFDREGRVAPFVRFSSGIGQTYLEQHKQEIIDKGYVEIGGQKFALPRYFRKKILSIATEDQLAKMVASQVDFLAEKLKKVSGTNKKFALELRDGLLCEYTKRGDEYVNSLFFCSRKHADLQRAKRDLKKKYELYWYHFCDEIVEDFPSFMSFLDKSGYWEELRLKELEIQNNYMHLVRYSLIDLELATYFLNKKIDECRCFFADEVVQRGKNYCFKRRNRMKKRIQDRINHG